MSEIPQWFWDAVETESEAGFVEVADRDINHLSWSQSSGQGLLFVHGHNAHAHWWDFIAPSFKNSFQTAALDLTGMGDSDHRDAYSNDLYAEEIKAVADSLKMPKETTLVAHSFGGLMAIRACAKYPGRFNHLVLVDSGVRHPEDIKEREPQIDRLQQRKVYPSKEIAQGRFRLQPPQQCENQYLVDYIAQKSLEFDDDGWVWKFDEELNSRMSILGDLAEDFQAISANNMKMSLIYGAQSESFSEKSALYMKELVPELEIVKLENAQHHLFLDQPEEFIDKLSSLI
ncbi:MAG: alpha/beta hydrolase [Pseudomonadales bacterium]|nr:alpha/beta hydrolase [Pseudomonadales bacterium]